MNASVDLENVINNLENQQEDDFIYAGIFVRYLAIIFDMIIAVFLFYHLLAMTNPGLYFDWKTMQMEGFSAGSSWIQLLLSLSYTLGFWLIFQATPGKMIVNCRIVDAMSGDRPRISQYLIRFVVLNLCMIVPVFGFFWLAISILAGGGVSMLGLALMSPILGLMWIPFDDCKQGLHDKLANTAVIY
ncbi:MAG: RDD family protein [Gammaproteobacteria bacterium]|nr:RDD family protein [Gammaproteobacteria bacterium]